MSDYENNIVTENDIPAEYKPISMWGYFGYEILFAIPIVGFIVALVLAFAASNKNVKNFARGQFCALIVAVILVIIVMAAAGSSAALSMMDF